MVASRSSGSRAASWCRPGSPSMPAGLNARRSRPAEKDGPVARTTTRSACSLAQAPAAARARQVAGVCALRRSGASRTTSSRRPEATSETPAAVAAPSRAGGGPSGRLTAGLPGGRRPAAAGRDGPASPVGSVLLALAAGGTSAAAQAHVVLGEDAVDEAVRPARLLRQGADARAVGVLLRELAGELGSVGSRDPGALLDSLGH